MNPAYRIPVGKFPVVARFVSQEDATSTPITEMVVNSLITSHRDGAKVQAGNGHGQRAGLGRRLWHPQGRGLDRRRQDLVGAKLGQDLGRYAFRPWSSSSTPSAARIR